MLKTRRSVFSFLVILSALLWSSSVAQGQKKLVLGMVSISGGIDILHVTKKIGAFRRNGLDVDMVIFQSSTQALQALFSGDVKVISGGGGAAAQKARMKGAGNVLVSTYTPTLPYGFFVSSKIKTPRDLKGGKVAVSSFGSSPDFAVRFILTQLGLDPNRDVTILQAGNEQTRVNALLSGAVDATVIGIPNTLLARRQGFTQLADASALGLKYPHNNITMTDAFIRDDPETGLAFLRAFVEGIAYYKSHKAESLPMIKEFLRLKEDALAEEAHSYFSRLAPAKPYPSIDGVRTVLAEVAKTDPEARSASPERFVEPKFIRQLDESGFIDRLYQKN
ncbi:MAG: ABC transporter substrate-binding protein [Deltaproteobacteria bacterium]|nr:ABC transporter substrate-binding protein [Deltaproteobacteria bacterium]